MKVTVKLWEHQVKLHNFAVNILKQYGFCYWYAGCATGKTLASLKIIETAKFKKTLVLTTKAAITSAWLSDINKYTQGATVVPLLKGTSKQKAALLKTYKDVDNLIVIVNYETARLIVPQIKQMGFDFAISDESQKLKSYNSVQSLDLAEACSKIPYKLCMTGTGWDDSPLDLYGQYRWLDPILERGNTLHSSTIFGRYHRDFFPKYAEYYERDNIRIPTGYKNLPDLSRKIDPTLIRVSTDDVRDLPPFQVINRVVDMPAKLRRMYKEMSDESILLLDDGIVTADNALVLAMRLHQLTGGFVKTPEGKVLDLKDNTKIEETRAILEEIGGQPTVIFTRFQEDVAKLKKALIKDKHDIKLLVGGTHQHNEFQAGEGDVLIANISAGAEGIDLSRARYCIYYSVDHSRTLYEQSRWRIRRKEGDKTLTYYHLIMKDTIDEDIYAALQSKGNVKDILANAITRRVK